MPGTCHAQHIAFMQRVCKWREEEQEEQTTGKEEDGQKNKIKCMRCIGQAPPWCVCKEEGRNKINQQQQKAEEQDTEGTVVHLSGSTLMCLRSMLNPICLLTSMSYFKAASVGAV